MRTPASPLDGPAGRGAGAAPPPAPTPPPRGRRIGLFARLVALVAAASLPPLALLSLLLIAINADALRISARELHLALAADARRALRAELARASEELGAMGLLLLAPGLGSDEQRLALVGTNLAASPSFDFVTVYGPDGQRVGTVKAREVEVPDMPERLPDAVRRGAGSSLLAVAGPRRGARGPVLEVYREVKVDDRVRGFLGAHLPLAPLSDLLAELGLVRLGARDAIFVVDGDRRLVVHADPERALAREPMAGRGPFAAIGGDASFETPLGISPEFGEDGRAMLGALETVPELGWAVAVQRPRRVAYASLERMRGAAAAAAALAALMTIGAGLFGARRLARPIRALVRATREIAARRFVRVEDQVPRRRDELGVLGRAMEEMAGSLARSEAELVVQTRVRGALSRYLAPDVVERVVRDPDALRLGGQLCEATILFADVVGFTRLSAGLPPEAVVALLNDLFTIATQVVQHRGGMVDKFIGDSVMAVWGAPRAAPDDPLRAVQAAADLRRWLDTGNRRWRQRWGIEVHLAMGLHTGQAVAGNVGSEKRMEYTVIGEAVNTAARVERLAKGGQILVSETTRDRIAALAAPGAPALVPVATTLRVGAREMALCEVPA
ncbi:MAG TPA: adenylate/guanylate cyclase domain-containing protein [Anaeromyxobacteraceae bacterium]|nr:adenylate/guanylate cyclase domain-containing protein [Anaeromyxobacteraceae bacterium]